jgi:hypothetical protein
VTRNYDDDDNNNDNNNENTRKFPKKIRKSSVSATHSKPTSTSPVFKAKETEHNIEAQSWKEVFSARSRS